MNKLGIAMALAGLLVAFQNCSGDTGTIVGNPLSSITEEAELLFAPYLQPSQKTGYVALSAKPGVQILVCFSSVRFYRHGEGPAQGERLVYDRDRGEVEIEQAGTPMGLYDLPMGDYFRVELRFKGEDLCEDQYSVKVINEFGTFTTQTYFRVKYEDLNQSITGPGQSIIIPPNSIIEALESVSSQDDLDEAFLSAPEVFPW